MRLWGPLALLVLAAVVALNVAIYAGGLTPQQVSTYFSAASPAQQTAVLLLSPVRSIELASPPPPAPVAVRHDDMKKAATDSCGLLAHTELAGRVVRWGADHLTDDAGACCRACAAHSECNVWVFCPLPDGAQSAANPLCTPRQCWLKHQALFAGLPAGVMASDPATPWVSGQLDRFMETAAPDAASLGLTMKELDPTTSVAVPPPRARECGSPASDAYASVKPACLEASATAKEFDHSEAGRMAQVVWVETHASYDGLAVAWGVGNKKASPAACADACRRHVADPVDGPPRLGGMFGKLPCNAFVYCPVGEARCFEPDAHMHTGGDCWLKFTEVPESPEVNGRGAMTDPATFKNGVAYNARHPAANKPLVPWVSGVLLPPGASPGNGTWGPRALW